MTTDDGETAIDTLIVVCCHAIYTGAKDIRTGNRPEPSLDHSTQPSPAGKPSSPNNVYDESHWLIEPFQQGEVSTFIDHVRTGVAHLAANEHAILCFSGGATKPAKTVTTEAQGYRDVAAQMSWFEGSPGACDNGSSIDGTVGSRVELLPDRAFMEEWATDSYQNVLLSLIQFPIWVRGHQAWRKESQGGGGEGRQTCGSSGNGPEDVAPKVQLRLPRRLVIVTHAFKRERFIELHLPAIASLWKSLQEQDRGWKITEVNITGADPPFDAARMRDIEEGDRKRGYGAWKTDLHGTSDLLSEKRQVRGWDQDKFLQSMERWFEEHDLKVIRRLVQGTSGSASR